jgi:branched-chain amino acid transport system permease protein
MLSYVYEVATLAAIFVVGSLSLAIIVSQAGLLSMAHGAFVGVGAYTFSLMATSNWHPVTAVCTAVIVTALLGAVLAYFASGSDEEQFAVITLAFHILVVNILTNWASVTKGAYGIAQIPRVTVLGFGEGRVDFLLVCIVIAVAIFLLMQWLATSGFGTLLRASAVDRDMVESMGSSVQRLRIIAFSIGCAGAGLAGALFAMHAAYIAPQSFDLHLSILLLAMVIVATGRSMIGPVIGAGIMIIIPESLRFVAFDAASAGPLRQVIFGAILVVVVFGRSWQAHRQAALRGSDP